jgi:integrase
MTAAHSTALTSSGKPATPDTSLTPAKPNKPRPDFPLFPHATKRWAKKIRGKVHYFGPWSDAAGAEKKYLEQREDLHAGRTPRPTADPNALTIKAAVNSFLNAKLALRNAGELSPRTWDGYKIIGDELVSRLGKARLVADLRPEDFAKLRVQWTKRWGPYRLKNAIQIVRSIFKHAYDSGMMDRPLRFGPGFKRPTMKTIRLHRAKQGAKLFSAEEIHRVLAKASVPMKAIILLGINCGFGNADCGTLPLTALDLERGWVDYPRPKTGIARRCPLWPETVQAIREALAERPAPKSTDRAELVFITKRGLPWAKDVPDSPITKEMRKLLDAEGINGHRNFYTTRHTFRTVADESKDQPAVDYIMGHEVPHMSAVYRETISEARLKAVADHVHAWLFAPEKQAGKSGEEE